MHAKNLMQVLLLIFSLYIIHCTFFIARGTVRYVSHTGSSTPPYTSWFTASDSIQKCINYSVSGDTIIVANGVYYESLIVNKYLWLIGSSMDSTVIDGTGLNNNTVDAQSDFTIAGFTIFGKGRNIVSSNIISSLNYNVDINNCKLLNAGACIAFGLSSGKVDNVILGNCLIGLSSFCYEDTCHPKISHSIIIMENSNSSAINIFDGGNPIITNNIIIGNNNSNKGISIGFTANTFIVENNIVSGFEINNINIANTMDTAFVINNISSYLLENNFNWPGIEVGPKANLRNNINANCEVGIQGDPVTESDYNLFWQNVQNTSGGLLVGENDIIADPMFVNDTIPVYGGSYDYHLQAYSPAIDAGDPNILDIDGTRSDIGVYGGPLGERYAYLDLPPRAPVNLTAEMDSINITLSWNRNTEADFSYYRIYRDTVSGFIIDSTKLISSQADTFYVQTIPSGITRLVYKLTAVDSQGNASYPSEELIVNITLVKDYPVTISDYTLYQNYPNPFNPTTKIGYRLKERGYVKLMVYDIKGELVELLVNEVKDAGYYEEGFGSDTGYRNPETGIGHLASGIYIYRIEVIGEGNIPRFSDMKKMLLIK